MPRVAAKIPDLDRIRAKVVDDEPLTDAELMAWKGWSYSTKNRYRVLGMPYVPRPGMQTQNIPSDINDWLAGKLPQRPAPRRGRPRKTAVH